MFYLNLFIAILIMSFFDILTIELRTLITFSFCMSVKLIAIFSFIYYICSFIFSILLTSLHLLKDCPTLIVILLKSWINAFYLIADSLLSLKVVSLTDLMAKFKEANKFETSKDSLSDFVFYVRFTHLSNIFTCEVLVAVINWMAARFFNTYPT